MMRHFKSILKISLVAGLLYFLGQKGFISVYETERAFREWKETLPAIGMLTVATVLGIIRWQILLKAQGIHLPFHRTLQLNMVGMFFNIALPGAVSGDLLKAFYIGKEIPDKRGRAFGSILFDRVAGLSALVMVSVTAFLISSQSFAAVRVFMLIAALTVAASYAYLFLVREHHDPLLKVLRKIEGRISHAGLFTRVYEGLRHYHDHRLAVSYVLTISVVIHLMVGWICLKFAYALGENHLTLLSLYVIVPLGLLVTAVPVAPAGIGTGHTAFFYLFGLLGSRDGANIYTLYSLGQILFGALGGLIYLQFRSQATAPNFKDSKAEINVAR